MRLILLGPTPVLGCGPKEGCGLKDVGQEKGAGVASQKEGEGLESEELVKGKKNFSESDMLGENDFPG